MVPVSLIGGGRRIVVLGVLIGLVIGAAACARFLREEVTTNGLRLRRIEMQLDAMRAELDLANETRLATLRKRLERGPPED
jgi:uncharacterized membrane-anchored protein YhcB (DUF1043 family)